MFLSLDNYHEISLLASLMLSFSSLLSDSMATFFTVIYTTEWLFKHPWAIKRNSVTRKTNLHESYMKEEFKNLYNQTKVKFYSSLEAHWKFTCILCQIFRELKQDTLHMARLLSVPYQAIELCSLNQQFNWKFGHTVWSSIWNPCNISSPPVSKDWSLSFQNLLANMMDIA